MEKHCPTCKHSFKPSPTSIQGKFETIACRRYPPTVGGQIHGGQLWCLFPPVDASITCGEWTPKLEMTS